jgi:hypothetical protein
MLNLNICARCPRGEYSPSRVSREGEMTGAPSVECEVEGGLLLCDSEIPSGCPYILEQKLTENEAWDNMEAIREEFYEESLL